MRNVCRDEKCMRESSSCYVWFWEGRHQATIDWFWESRHHVMIDSERVVTRSMIDSERVGIMLWLILRGLSPGHDWLILSHHHVMIDSERVAIMLWLILRGSSPGHNWFWEGRHHMMNFEYEFLSFRENSLCQLREFGKNTYKNILVYNYIVDPF